MVEDSYVEESDHADSDKDEARDEAQRDRTLHGGAVRDTCLERRARVCQAARGGGDGGSGAVAASVYCERPTDVLPERGRLKDTIVDGDAVAVDAQVAHIDPWWMRGASGLGGRIGWVDWEGRWAARLGGAQGGRMRMRRVGGQA